jgi:phosphatidylglycerol:prolipoprotein diacylglycerol transferase
MHPILFKIGPITIYTYGLFIFLGVLAGYIVCRNQAKASNISLNIFSDIFFWSLLSGFLGARIFYILIEWRIFLRNPLGIIFSRSGFVFYGGLIAGIIMMIFLSHRNKISFLKIGDIFAIGTPLAHSLGRLGCFFYGCCYGRPSSSFISILFPPDSPAGFSGLRVIPTQLISAFFLLFIFFLLLVIKKYKKFDGYILFVYIFIYGIFRFIIEFFRGDPRGHFFSFSTSQAVSIFAVVLSMTLFYWYRQRSCNFKKNKYNRSS